MKEKMFKMVKSFLFRIVKYFKREEIEELNSVIGIALQDRIHDAPITIECFDGNDSILKCTAGEDLKIGDWVTFSEEGKVKKYERKNT